MTRQRLSDLGQRMRATLVDKLRWLATNTFAPRWLPSSLREKWWVGYVVAVLAQALAVLADTLFVHLFPAFAVRGLLMALIVALVALSWGAGPSFLATFVGAVFLDVFLLPPYFSASLATPDELVSFILLIVVGCVISVVASQVERAHREAQTLAGTLATERARLNAVIEAIPDMLFIHNAAGDIVQLNEAGQHMAGAQPATTDTATAPLASIPAAGHLLTMDGDPYPAEALPVARALRGEAVSGVELRSLASDGEELYLTMSAAPFRAQKQKITGAVAIAHDVTEHRRLERRTHEALAALLEMAQTIVSSDAEHSSSEHPLYIPEPLRHPAYGVGLRLAELTRSVLGCQRIVITSLDPENDMIQPVALVGLKPEREPQWWQEQPIGVRLSDNPDQALAGKLRAGDSLLMDMTQPPYDQQPNPDHVRQLLLVPMLVGERLYGFIALDYGGADHTYTPQEFALAGAVARLTGLVIERERLLRQREQARGRELALVEANRRMDEFLGIASHELRTPLTSVKANVQLVRRRIKLVANGQAQVAAPATQEMANKLRAAEELLERSDRQVDRLARLVNDLLDVSRIQSGRLEMRPEPCDLVAQITDAVQEQRQGWPDRVIALNLAENSVPVCADADRIGQVITNLLTNALKYSAEDQPVAVTLSIEGELSDLARVAVRDCGPGLPETEQAHIWERFHRVPGIEQQSGSGVGLGLGLYISRTIIERHGGHIGVESAPGQGSTFWFTLSIQGACDEIADTEGDDL
ncbi:MAG: ATP-binding protein [Ktedonobacterales bacterium]